MLYAAKVRWEISPISQQLLSESQHRWDIQYSPLSPWQAAGGSRRPTALSANLLPKQQPAEESGLVSPWCRPAAPYTWARGASYRAWRHRSRGDRYQIRDFGILTAREISYYHPARHQESNAVLPCGHQGGLKRKTLKKDESQNVLSWNQNDKRTHLKSAQRGGAARLCTPPPSWLPVDNTNITVKWDRKCLDNIIILWDSHNSVKTISQPLCCWTWRGRCAAARPSTWRKQLNSCLFRPLALAYNRDDRHPVTVTMRCTVPGILWNVRRSPHAEQAIVSGGRQEVEAIAVGGSCGGKAKRRHSGGVSSEPLQDQQTRRCICLLREIPTTTLTCFAFTCKWSSLYKYIVVRLQKATGHNGLTL